MKKLSFLFVLILFTGTFNKSFAQANKLEENLCKKWAFEKPQAENDSIEANVLRLKAMIKADEDELAQVKNKKKSESLNASISWNKTLLKAEMLKWSFLEFKKFNAGENTYGQSFAWSLHGTDTLIIHGTWCCGETETYIIVECNENKLALQKADSDGSLTLFIPYSQSPAAKYDED